MSKIICEKSGKDNEKQKWHQSVWDMCHGRPLKVSELETISEMSDDDCIMITDMSELKSKKVTLGALKEYLKV
jgi:hypothetical protein